jgi:heat shock protein HtpX
MYKAIARNKRITVILIAVFVLIFAVFSSPFIYAGVQSFQQGDTESASGLWIFAAMIILGSFLYAFCQYYFSAKIALSMTGAKQVELGTTDAQELRLLRIVHSLSIAEGFEQDPAVYIIDESAPNAFATGRDVQHSAIAATSGLLEIMDDRELRAVLGHEISHIKNYDIRVSMIVFGLVVAVTTIALIVRKIAWMMIYSSGRSRSRDSGLISLFGVIPMHIAAALMPIVASFVQLAVSRQREYLADVSSVELVRDPDGMISALKKLISAGNATIMQSQNTATAHLYFISPLNTKSFTNRLFSTHPPLEKRIERLMATKYRFNEMGKVSKEELATELNSVQDYGNGGAALPQ